MTQELRRRVVLTLVLLASTRLLWVIPIPGVDIQLLNQSMAGAQTPDQSGLFSQLTPTVPASVSIGGDGLTPYLVGSMLVTTIAWLRRRRGIPSAWALEKATVSVALGWAFLAGMAHAQSLEQTGVLNAPPLVQHPGLLFWISAGACRAAALLATILAAWLISSRGIGSGVCLIVATTAAPDIVRHFWGSLSGDSPGRKLAALVLAAAAVTYLFSLRARWHSEPSKRFPHGLSLPINGVGIAGLPFAAALLTLGVIVSKLFLGSLGLLGYFLTVVGTPGPTHAGILFAVAFSVACLYIAWAFDPRSLLATGDAAASGAAADDAGASSDATVDEPGFDRRVERTMVPFAFTVCAGVAIVEVLCAWIGSRDPLEHEPTNPIPILTSLLVVAAIVLDAHAQWRTHEALAASGGAQGDDAETCGDCGARVDAEDPFCRACGVGSNAPPPCDRHPETTSAAQCVVCGARLCLDCTRVSDGRCVCEEHATAAFVEGWAVVAHAATRVEADLLRSALAACGIPAEVLFVTTSPIAGTLGLFDLNPVVPLFPHRQCGGGSIRVLVPPRRWVEAWSAARRLGYGVPVQDPLAFMPARSPAPSVGFRSRPRS